MRTASEQIGYDELLARHTKQLKKIEERIDQIIRRERQWGNPTRDLLCALRYDVKLMIQRAEEEHRNF